MQALLTARPRETIQTVSSIIIILWPSLIESENTDQDSNAHMGTGS